MLYVIYFAALVYLLSVIREPKRRRIANLRARHQSFEK